MRRIVTVAFLTILVSFFVFPVGFTFLPDSLNSKMILAGTGILFFIYDLLKDRTVRLSHTTLISGFIALVFSAWCLFSTTANGTTDNTYVTYWRSFATWMLGAYAVYFLLRQHSEKVDLCTLTRFLAIVCVCQCVIALLIDNISGIKRFVDSIFVGGEYFSRYLRLYGIGCALDPAGCRFSVVQVMIAHQIATNKDVRNSTKSLLQFLLAFIAITVIGSMISRTTMVGSALGLGFIVISVFRLRKGGFITKDQFRLFLVFFLLITTAIMVTVGVYRASSVFRSYLRFGFEGFFTWAETGEFHTGSTDTLMQLMWIWPSDPRTWMIGSGRIGVFEWGTDIGYCNFVLTCGLIGLVIYSGYFIYNHLSLNGKYNNFFITSLLLIALTFIIWAKVTTDIFFIDALLFCIDGDKQNE